MGRNRAPESIAAAAAIARDNPRAGLKRRSLAGTRAILIRPP